MTTKGSPLKKFKMIGMNVARYLHVLKPKSIRKLVGARRPSVRRRVFDPKKE